MLVWESLRGSEGSQLNSINVTVPFLGLLTGAGTVSPEGVLNFRMVAELTGSGDRNRGGVPFVIDGLNPYEHGILVLSVGKKCQIQALDRIHASLPLRRVR